MTGFQKDAFRRLKILVVGDVGLDEYIHGDVRRLSPEAPVPILEVEKEDLRLGLSANVALNIRDLGGEPWLLSVVGEDDAYRRLAELMEKGACSSRHLLVDSDRPTTRKTRVMAQHHHIVRIDYEKRQFLSGAVEAKVLDSFAQLIPQCDGVVLQDYGKGVISENVAQSLIKEAKRHGKKVLVDPYRSTPVTHYRGADLMTPNHDESLALAGWVKDDLHQDGDYIDRVGRTLMAAVGSGQMVITLGAQGMRLFEGDRATSLPTFARKVFDVTGAGDTVISTMALAWCGGMSLAESCRLANAAASVVVAKIGCGTCSPEELEASLAQMDADG